MSTEDFLFESCLALSIVMGIRAATIAAGTTIAVRANDAINARDAGKGRVYSGVVDRDVTGLRFRVAPTLN